MKKIVFFFLLCLLTIGFVWAEFDSNKFANDLLNEFKNNTQYKCSISVYGTNGIDIKTRDGWNITAIISSGYIQIVQQQTYADYSLYVNKNYDGKLNIGALSSAVSAAIIIPEGDVPMGKYVEKITDLIEKYLIPVWNLFDDYTFTL